MMVYYVNNSVHVNIVLEILIELRCRVKKKQKQKVMLLQIVQIH